MNIQVVEPLSCLGETVGATDTTLAIASKLTVEQAEKLNVFKELWVDNGQFEVSSNYETNTFESALEKQIKIANKHALAQPKGRTYFALPDVPLEQVETERLVDKYLDHIKKHLLNDVVLVGIPQGKDQDEFEDSIEYLRDSIEVDVLGYSCLDRRWINKTASNWLIGDDIFQYFYNAAAIDPQQVHVLGFELFDLEYEGFYKANSFDTSYPLKLLYNNIMPHHKPVVFGQDIPRQKNYFKLTLPKELVVKQVKDFIQFIGDERKKHGY